MACAADGWVSQGAEACDAGSPHPVHVDLIPGLVVGVDILHGLWFRLQGLRGLGETPASFRFLRGL